MHSGHETPRPPVAQHCVWNADVVTLVMSVSVEGRHLHQIKLYLSANVIQRQHSYSVYKGSQFSRIVLYVLQTHLGSSEVSSLEGDSINTEAASVGHTQAYHNKQYKVEVLTCISCHYCSYHLWMVTLLVIVHVTTRLTQLALI